MALVKTAQIKTDYFCVSLFFSPQYMSSKSCVRCTHSVFIYISLCVGKV